MSFYALHGSDLDHLNTHAEFSNCTEKLSSEDIRKNSGGRILEGIVRYYILKEVIIISPNMLGIENNVINADICDVEHRVNITVNVLYKYFKCFLTLFDSKSSTLIT